MVGGKSMNENLQARFKWLRPWRAKAARPACDMIMKFIRR